MVEYTTVAERKHDGTWTRLSFEVSISPGNTGPLEEDINPLAFILFAKKRERVSDRSIDQVCEKEREGGEGERQ